MLILVGFVICTLLIYLLYYSNSHKCIIPEGLKELSYEKGYPILGIIPQLKPTLMLHFAKLSRTYGPIYKVRLGMRDFVILNSYDVINKSLKENGDLFLGRSNIEWILILSKNSGTFYTEGESWANQRSFLLSVIRDFGLGKAKFFDSVQNECQFLLDELMKFGGKSVDFAELIPLYTANIICKFIMNKRFSREDQNLKSIEYLMKKLGRNTDYVTWISVMFPLLNNGVFFNKLMINFIIPLTKVKKIQSFFYQEIEEHRNRFDFCSEPEDLIDRFLMKQQEMREKTATDGIYTDAQMIQNSFELFMAGSETTSQYLVWGCLFMSKFPDIQEKIYLEIVDKIGNERTPTMNDKKNLIYSQAVMDEIMRLGTAVNLIARKTLADTSVNGYFIPQNTFIISNSLASNLDPDIWQNPWEFTPNRFLNVDSNGNLKYSPREELIPFSVGKRQCIGEPLGRMEFFMFLISILQKFKVRFSNNITDKEYRESLIANDGIIRVSKIKDFIFSLRNDK